MILRLLRYHPLSMSSVIHCYELPLRRLQCQSGQIEKLGIIVNTIAIALYHLVTVATKACPFCETLHTLSSYQRVRQHVASSHHIFMATRTTGRHSNRSSSDSTMFGCPSCTETFRTLQELKEYAMCHVVINADEEQNRSSQTNDWEAAFLQFRREALNQFDSLKYVDGNFNQLLAISGICVLQKRSEYPTAIPAEVKHQWRKEVLSKYKRSLDMGILHTVKETMLGYHDGAIDFCIVQIQLLQCAASTSDVERKVILSVQSLIPALKDLKVDSLRESELSSSFGHPFVQALLSGGDANRVARCGNTTPVEMETYSRPDYFVDQYQQYERAFTTCFGEFKDDRTACVPALFDFYRLAIFAKEELDRHHLDSILCFQAIGLQFTFYIMSRKSPFLYLFTELYSITLPRTLQSLNQLLGSLDDMLSISYAHSLITPLENRITPQIPTLQIEYVHHNQTTLSPSFPLSFAPINNRNLH